MDKLELDTAVSKVHLVGPAYAKRLEKLGISTIQELLYHLPSHYDDYSVVSKIDQLQEGETVTIQGKILEIRNLFTGRGFILQKARVQDDSGVADVIWFNQHFLTSVIHKNDQVSLSGKVRRNGRQLQLESPDYEIIKSADLSPRTIHTGRLVPVYPETAGVTSKWLRNRISNLLCLIEQGTLAISETLDQAIIDKNNLLPLKDALFQIHFPDNLELAEKARRRLAFEELLISQLRSANQKKRREGEKVANKFRIIDYREKLKSFIDHLPFTLTHAQKAAVNDIFKDLASNIPMNRLLEGDVGSGKTVVAALAMLAAKLNGYQSVLMAPTEILAQQHFGTINKLLAPLKIGVGIATGSQKNYQGFDIVVGTHALLSDKLNFKKLGLVVIDEQHRFGVEQRAAIARKGINPHILTMTATPIPRTVALTLYGDLDLSVLDEMPKDRIPIKTWLVEKTKRDAAYNWIRSQKTQSFIICPLIDESESLATVRAASVEFEHLTKTVFPDLRLGLLHGRMKSKEKDAVLERFRKQKLDILVATPIVEVGIDIPTATIMVIEDADRFGLAQLHQLRGRVGRGDRQSYCLLFSENSDHSPRLKFLEMLHSGMALAEVDLKFRGPGQRFGTAQHGHWDLKIADFSDLKLIEATHQTARDVNSHPSQFPTLQHALSESKINVASN